MDIEDVSSGKKTLKIEIPAEDVNAEIDKAYEEVRTSAPVKGFRKGRAPRGVLRMRFREYVKRDVIEKLVPPTLEKAVADAELEMLRPLDKADMKPPIEELLVKENEPLIFEVSVDVKPEIPVPDLSQLEVEKGDIDVTQDNSLQQLREERASFVPVEDRPVRAGDYVTLNRLAAYSSDGRMLKDERHRVLEVGKNMPVLELVEHLVGMNPDDEREFSISFPADYKIEHSTDWQKVPLAGKEIKFRMSLSKIAEKHLPALDDDFAKDLGEDDLQHLIAKVQRMNQQNDLLSQLLEKSQFEVPKFLVEEQAKNMVRSARQQAGTVKTGISEEELSQYRPSALTAIKRAWIFNEIAKREEIEVTDEDIENEVKRRAEERNRDPQKYMKLLEDAKQIDGIRESMRENRIFDRLIDKASPKRTSIV